MMEFLKLYKGNNAADIAKRLGRSVSAVRIIACRLGVTKTCVWSTKEVNLLKKLYPSRTAQEIADKLGKSVGTVRVKMIID